MKKILAVLLCLAATHVQAEFSPEAVDKAVAGGDMKALQAFSTGLEDQSDQAYELAYINWRINQMLERGSKEQKKLMKSTSNMVEDALEDQSDVELMALRATILGDRITGAFSAMTIGPKASDAIEEAFKLAPDNPRVALQRGMSFYFTPSAFGGGPEKAKAEFDRALSLFEAAGDAGDWPNWGHIETLAWLGRMHFEVGENEMADQYWNQALEISPDDARVIRHQEQAEAPD